MATGTGTFVAPDLTPYIRAALNGANTGAATIDRMLTSLEDQLTAGPLANLTAGTDTPATFSTEVNNYVVSYQASVSQQLSPRFPNITSILNLNGTKVSSIVNAYVTELNFGLITSAQFNTDAANAIKSLTGGPLEPIGTTNAGYAKATQSFIDQLNALKPAIVPGSTPHITPAQLQTVVDAGAQAYAAAMHASLVTHPYASAQVDKAVTDLTNAVANIAATNPTDPTVLYTTAVNAFDAALLDTTGFFGPQGAHKRGLFA